MDAGIATCAGPVLPCPLCHLKQGQRVDRSRRRKIGRSISQRKCHIFASRDDEAAAMPIAVRLDRRLGAQNRHVGTGDGLESVGFGTVDPWDDGAVIVAKDEFGRHGDGAAAAANDADEMAGVARLRLPGPERHEINQRDRAVLGLEVGLKDQGIGPVAAPNARRLRRGNAPMAVVRIPQETCKNRSGVEPRPA
jgi:hypothetical protein